MVRGKCSVAESCWSCALLPPVASCPAVCDAIDELIDDNGSLHLSLRQNSKTVVRDQSLRPN